MDGKYLIKLANQAKTDIKHLVKLDIPLISVVQLSLGWLLLCSS